jgi:hypothetical protein
MRKLFTAVAIAAAFSMIATAAFASPLVSDREAICEAAGGVFTEGVHANENPARNADRCTVASAPATIDDGAPVGTPGEAYAVGDPELVSRFLDAGTWNRPRTVLHRTVTEGFEQATAVETTWEQPTKVVRTVSVYQWGSPTSTEMQRNPMSVTAEDLGPGEPRLLDPTTAPGEPIPSTVTYTCVARNPAGQNNCPVAIP